MCLSRHSCDRSAALPALAVALRGWVLVALLGFLVTVASVSRARADDARVEWAFKELELTTLIRQKLHKDDDLAKLRINVTVHRNVATLWGDVPSKEHRDRALQLAQEIRGVAEVRDELHLIPKSEEASPFFGGPRPRFSPEELHRLEKKEPVPKSGLNESVTLGPPEPVTPVEKPSPGTTVQRQTPKGPAADIEALRQKDVRYQGLRVEVRQGLVYVRGSVARQEDAEEFAKSLRQVPGVAAVIIEAQANGSR
jgi:osmotically-inducible protein OsmY